jgi:hypothetical protein
MTLAASVLERLRRQQAKYREMVALVRAQRAGLASLDVDGILGLIEQKRKLLSEIDALEAELAPLKGTGPGCGPASPRRSPASWGSRWKGRKASSRSWSDSRTKGGPSSRSVVSEHPRPRRGFLGNAGREAPTAPGNGRIQ